MSESGRSCLQVVKVEPPGGDAARAVTGAAFLGDNAGNVAVGESVIKCPSPLKVIKDT